MKPNCVFLKTLSKVYSGIHLVQDKKFTSMDAMNAKFVKSFIQMFYKNKLTVVRNTLQNGNIYRGKIGNYTTFMELILIQPTFPI